MKKNNHKLLAAAAFVFFVPALYIILSEARKNEFLKEAARGAFFLWILEIGILFGLRLCLMIIYNSFRLLLPFDFMFYPFLLLMFYNVSVAALLLFNSRLPMPRTFGWVKGGFNH